MGCAAFVIAVGLLGTTSTALAQAQRLTGITQLAPADEFVLLVVFADPAPTEVTDLSGNVIGEAEHLGVVRCNGSHCNQKTQLQLLSPAPPTLVEYRFKDRVALDPVAERAVVAGTGVIASDSGKEKFAFTATFQNNGDGTVSVTYEASRPDASFILSNAPGTFTLFTRP
jgi:hypothetical protein